MKTKNMEDDIKRSTAQTYLEVLVNCPYCNCFQDIVGQVRRCLGDDLRAEDIEALVTCENKSCNEDFLVTEIRY